jgi:hypothetical protein
MKPLWWCFGGLEGVARLGLDGTTFGVEGIHKRNLDVVGSRMAIRV